MKDKILTIEIITPTMTVFKGEAEIVTIPGTHSEFQVLNDHTPIVSSLKPGVITIKLYDQETKFAISGGLSEVRDNNISIISTIALGKNDIDPNLISQKLNENKEKMLTNLSDAQLELLKQEIEFQKAQLRLFDN